MPRIGGHLDIAQVSDPTTPVAGRQHLYFKTDGKLYTRRPDGTVLEIGAGAGGSVSTDLVLPGTGGNNWRISADITGALVTTTTTDAANVAMLSPSSNLVTTNSAQSITAKKTFTVAPQIGDPELVSNHATVGDRGTMLSGIGGTYYGHNTYYDGVGWKNVKLGAGSLYGMVGLGHQWWTSASGAADAGTILDTAATLTQSGFEILVGGAYVKSPIIMATGAAGAQGVTRYAGGTASGAPTTGNFVVGDFVIARNGKVWICTVAGTPGTWVDAAGTASLPGNAVTTDTTQSISGSKTFTGGIADSVGRLSPNTETLYITHGGLLTVKTGVFRIPVPFTGEIESVVATVGTASGGAPIIVDINVNALTVYTTQANRPTLSIGGVFSSASLPNTTAVTLGQTITVDIDQVGSSNAGSDLLVAIRIRRT